MLISSRPEPQFEHAEDERFFSALLCLPSEDLHSYSELFDFRPPEQKRREFNRLRDHLLSQLIERDGTECQLRLVGCDPHSGVTIDHLIPLSSNKLNKELRCLVAEPGGKVRTQSFGSNHLGNLVIACGACNAKKKHRFLDGSKLRAILSQRTPRADSEEARAPAPGQSAAGDAGPSMLSADGRLCAPAPHP